MLNIRVINWIIISSIVPPSDTSAAYRLPAQAVEADFPEYSSRSTACTIPTPYRNIPNIIKYPNEDTSTTHDHPLSSSSICDIIGVIVSRAIHHVPWRKKEIKISQKSFSLLEISIYLVSSFLWHLKWNLT